MAAIVADLSNEIMFLKLRGVFLRGGYAFLPRHLRIRRDALRERVTLKRTLARCRTERGTVFVHQHGRDCDGVTFSRLVEMPAEIGAYEDAIDRELEWADGPMYHSIMTPEQAATFTPEPSRDLYLEAFEDGHPHVVYA